VKSVIMGGSYFVNHGNGDGMGVTNPLYFDAAFTLAGDVVSEPAHYDPLILLAVVLPLAWRRFVRRAA
jgi:hypothetical protein